MARFRTIAVSILVFGLVGPAIGAVVVFVSRGGDFPPALLPLSYVFGIVPALIAGTIYGVMRLRAKDSPFSWHARIIRGALAGLIGSLVFALLGSTYTLLTASVSTLQSELGFYRLMIAAGVSAGAVCAFLIGNRRRRPS
jgi:hypothetical protein